MNFLIINTIILLTFIWATTVFLAVDYSHMLDNPNHHPYYKTCLATNINNYDNCMKNTISCDIYMHTVDRFKNLSDSVDKLVVISPSSNHTIKQVININGYNTCKLNTTVNCLILDDNIIYYDGINTYCSALIKSCEYIFITSTTYTFIKITKYILFCNILLWFWDGLFRLLLWLCLF